MTALMALGRAQMLSSAFEDACATYQRVVELDAPNHEAWRALAESLRFRDRLDEALDAIKHAMALAPDNPRVMAHDVFIRMRACAWDGLDNTRVALRDITYKTLSRGQPSPMRPFMAATCYGDPALALEVGAAESRRLNFKSLAPAIVKQKRDDRLTVGYLSAGFCNHPTGQLVRRLFTHHDHKRLRVAMLDIGVDDGSDLLRELRGSCAMVLDLQRLSDHSAALAIRDAGVDILVDLHSWLQNHRMAIAAHRPCPVQVSWLGFPGTSGSSAKTSCAWAAVTSPTIPTPS
jgi:protein O-GlcNAc transferase